MKKVLALGLFVTATAMVGCGGSGETSNMMEGADQSAMQSYEQMIAEEEATLNASPDDDVPETPETPAETPAE